MRAQRPGGLFDIPTLFGSFRVLSEDGTEVYRPENVPLDSVRTAYRISDGVYGPTFRIQLIDGTILSYSPDYDTLYLCGTDISGSRHSVSILDVDRITVQVK